MPFCAISLAQLFQKLQDATTQDLPITIGDHMLVANNDWGSVGVVIIANHNTCEH